MPALFLTQKSNQRIIDSGGKSYFLDKKTGEICWLAMECRNPNCPGKSAVGVSYLFITPSPLVFLKTDGSLGFDAKRAEKSTRSEKFGGCPKCLKIRNLKSESSATRDRYAGYVQLHVLPETAKRLKELDEEYKRRVEWEKKKK